MTELRRCFSNSLSINYPSAKLLHIPLADVDRSSISHVNSIVRENQPVDVTFISHSGLSPSIIGSTQEIKKTSSPLSIHKTSHSENLISEGIHPESTVNGTAISTPLDYVSDVISSISQTNETVRHYYDLLQGSFESLRTLFDQSSSLSPKSDAAGNSEYRTIPSLARMLKDRCFVTAYTTVKQTFDQGNFLTPTELEQLILELYPQKTLAYSLVLLYSQKYDITAFDTTTICRMLMLSHSNNDYSMFDKLFTTYLNVSDSTDPSILSIAFKVYLDTDNVSMANQIFNQSVLTEPELPCFLLDKYLKNLKRTTRNVGLCYTAYRLWLSKDFVTWPKTDAFMYKFVRDCGSSEQLDWFMGSLARRNRATNPEILLVDLMLKLRKRTELDLFYSQGDYQKWVGLLSGSNFLLDEFETKLIDLNLSQGNYQRARTILINSDTEKHFLRRLDKIIVHLKEYRQTKTLVSLLSKLHSEAGLKIHEIYPEAIWDSLVKQYPQFSTDITKKFNYFVEQDRSHIFRSLLKGMKVEKDWRSDGAFAYPSKNINGKDICNDLTPLPDNPSIDAIESRIRCGINPTQHKVVKAMRYCENIDQFNRIVTLICHHPKELKMEDLGFQIQLFWKQRQFKMNMPGGRSVRNFLCRAIENMDSLDRATMRNLMELIMMSTKFEDFDLGYQILKYIRVKKLRPACSDDAQRLSYCLVNFFFKQKDFESLVLVLERVKEDPNINLNPFFIKSLVRLKEKYTTLLLEEEDEDPENFRKSVYMKLLNYYDKTICELNKKYRTERSQVEKEVDDDLQFLSSWIRDDLHREQ
ncbi:hypothetical protein FOA43_000390 [Brettanomyces nanus]|uniref:Uncharacterized protein n=1 Tax=Eeniella nana TaxID=13502 RepID=A0A875RYF4_EENNA|nr:uncharacterized protein FOA43_000390 [Brettanomyces nanus]QPG73085.1 hypothetical protein FOA43_000390 [Brettanomyces nanus]